MPEAWTPGDPVRAAQANMRPARLKRFYREATLGEVANGFTLLLDGRSAQTPGKRPLVLPNHALGEIIVAEWRGQGEFIAPAQMPLTRLANSALDGVAGAMAATRAEIAGYAASDLLCYRAVEPEELVRRQAAAFDPILAWAAQNLGAEFRIVQGIMPLAQPGASLAVIADVLAPIESPFVLAALHVATSLCGSTLLALAQARGVVSAGEAWRIAHIDEDFEISAWGEDAEAQARRAARWLEMQAAAQILALLRAPLPAR